MFLPIQTIVRRPRSGFAHVYAAGYYVRVYGVSLVKTTRTVCK